ncbi:hypothetical protein QF028_001569 [Neobacillus sp. B4I6]|uniref:DUF2750 domain-containing protein n=1 Tax=Neobacillus sp. B4I6 TaxID=3373925 RepID=UPI003D19DCA6
MEFDLTINSKRRYENFIKSVSESKTVWGLKSEDGWCVYESNDHKDTGVMLFWSDEAYARQFAVEEWMHYMPTSIPLDKFINWLYKMNADDLLVGVNWNTNLIGLEVDPFDLYKELGEVVLLEIEELREKIKQLDESYAKSLLLIIYTRLDTAINGTGGDEVIKQTVKDLFDMYSKLPDSKKFKK